MRVAVIRGDLPGPIFIADLESTSQYNPSTEAPGQTRYLSRPSATAIAQYLTAQGLVASATTLITATVPVGGPVDVSSATIKGVSGLSGASAAQVTALQDLLAPQFYETQSAKESFQVGNLAKFRSSTFNPDPRRIPAFTNGAAISVVADDGVTAFAAALPNVTGAAFAGALTVTGTGLGSAEVHASEVILSTPTAKKTIKQSQIVAAGGSVSATSIVVPAGLLTGFAAGAKVRVRAGRQLSNEFTTT